MNGSYFSGTEIEAEYLKQKAKIDAEYMSFLDEVGVQAPPSKAAKSAQAVSDYESFMSDLGIGGPPTNAASTSSSASTFGSH